MAEVKITVVESRCRSGYHREGDTFIVDDLCPPICHELWNNIYPSLYAIKTADCLIRVMTVPPGSEPNAPIRAVWSLKSN